MIIPSIDLMNNQAVQLIGGKEHALNAGDPQPILRQFQLAGEVAIIDLDRALGKGSCEQQINALLEQARGSHCKIRLGGGIRTEEHAITWLDRGVDQVILGTSAIPEILSKLPKERVIAALDAVNGELVVNGWQTKTGELIEDRLKQIKPYVSGVMITFVEREGRMMGIDLNRIQELKRLCAPLPLTIAGGIKSLQEIADLDTIGVDAQVGMALYTNQISLADAIIAPLLAKASPDGSQAQLWPTVVVDEQGVALGLCWSSRESVGKAVSSLAGVYQSRKRGLWIKGETSGATQELRQIALDCDRDTLRFTVRQAPPGFCHQNTRTCWGDSQNILFNLEALLKSRISEAPDGSYTKRLMQDATLLKDKIEEEAAELVEATELNHIAAEAADLLYFTLVYLAKNGVELHAVEKVLQSRMSKVTRRPGNSKINRQ